MSHMSKEVEQKLGIIVKLMAAMLTKEMSQREAVEKLNSLGIDRQTLADVLNTTPATVNARLTEIKKKKGKK